MLLMMLMMMLLLLITAAYAYTAAYADAALAKESIVGFIKDKLQSKPRTKTEYVNVHKSNTTPYEFCQMILDGIKFYDGEHCGGHYDDINSINRYGRGSQSLYRKVEKEIDWREDFESFFNTTDYLSRNDKLCSVYNGDKAEDDEKWDCEFIAMCRLVESLTRHIKIK